MDQIGLNIKIKVLKIDLKRLKKRCFWTKNAFLLADLGVPPLPCCADNIFGKKVLADLGGTPPPFTDKIRQTVFERLPKSDHSFEQCLRLYSVNLR